MITTSLIHLTVNKLACCKQEHKNIKKPRKIRGKILLKPLTGADQNSKK